MARFKGSIYDRKWSYQGKKRKAWGVRYSVNGKVARKIVGTKEEAEDELERLKDDHRHRLLGVAEGKTLRELAEPFLEHKRAHGRDMTTLEARLKNLLPHFGDTPLEAVEEEIDAYVLKRREDGVSNSTINRETAVLSHMLHYAARKKRWLRHLPYIEKLEENGARDRELTEAEEKSIMNECSQDFRDLFEAALLIGKRQGLLTHLTVGQVDLENRLITFPSQKRGLKGILPINERLYHILARRIRNEGKARLSPANLVFSENGRAWQRWTIRNRLQKAMGKTGIENLRFHDSRHTIGSRLRRRGADMDHIRKILGHRGIKTTEGYVHYEAEQLRPILALLESTNVTQDGQLVSGKPSNPL